MRASPLARAAPLVRGARGRRSRARAQRFGFGRGDGDDEVDRLRETLSDWRDEREGATGGAARAAARAQRAAEVRLRGIERPSARTRASACERASVLPRPIACDSLVMACFTKGSFFFADCEMAD